jgi:hypothetical protein
MDKVMLERFFGAVNRQFSYGGQKYAQTKEKEATDCLFCDFGKNWLFGTLAKYCKRYSNLKREKDMMKIATYCFIIWLKRGFHLNNQGTKEIINTTVDIKSKFFSVFQEKFNEYLGTEHYSWAVLSQNDALGHIYTRLYAFGMIDFDLISDIDLFDIFYYTYFIWNKDTPDDKKETDEDVYNEKKEK